MSPEEAKKLIFQDYWKYIQQLVKRRFAANLALADQAETHVLEELSKDGWRKVRSYRGQGFSSFLTVVVNRLLTDFARNIGDSLIIPKELKQRGGLWKKAWNLLCQKQSKKEETFQMLWDEAQRAGYREEYLRQVISLVIPKCKDKFREEQDADETIIGQFESSGTDCRMLLLLFEVLPLLLPEIETGDLSGKLKSWIECLRNANALKSSEELLLLRMVHEDGLGVSEAGRRLELPLSAHEVSGRHRRLLERLRKAMENCGLDKDFWLGEE
jgi:hypothetical protein